MHYAVYGHTVAELIVERADNTKEHMGLTTWADAPEGKIKKSDVTVVKNYLSQDEMKQLNRMVTAYLDFAENMTLRHIPLTMQDWKKRLNSFIEMFDYGILQDTGKVSTEIVKLHAETEFEKYCVIQDRLFMSDFDRYMLELEESAKKYEYVNKGKDTRTHLLSEILKCPICEVGMFGNKYLKKKKDGTKYKDFYYYGCKHRQMIRGHKCTFSKQIREELLDDAVAKVIVKIVSNPKFASMMQEKINMKVDTSEIEKEIDNYQKELRKSHFTKFKLIEEIDNLDVEDKQYKRRKQDLDDRLYRMYDKIDELESSLIDAKAKKQTIEAEKLTGDNIYKVLIYFDKLYKVMNDVERRQLITALISEIQVYEEKQPNGQWLNSITFKLPIIDDDLIISLDNDEQVETVALIQKM